MEICGQTPSELGGGLGGTERVSGSDAGLHPGTGQRRGQGVLRPPAGAVAGDDQLGCEFGERGHGRGDDRLKRGAAEVEAADDGEQAADAGQPPGVPDDRVAMLRKAFVAALGDKTLRAEADKMQFDVDPMPGDELQKLVTELYATPPHLIERARQALTVKAGR